MILFPTFHMAETNFTVPCSDNQMDFLASYPSSVYTLRRFEITYASRSLPFVFLSQVVEILVSLV